MSGASHSGSDNQRPSACCTGRGHEQLKRSNGGSIIEFPYGSRVRKTPGAVAFSTPLWFIFRLLLWSHLLGLREFGHLFLQHSDGLNVALKFLVASGQRILMLLLHILHLT